MHPMQMALLIALAIGAALYVWRGVTRSMRADADFFRTLVDRLSQVLGPKGFRLTRNVHLPQSLGHRVARFEGSELLVDAGGKLGIETSCCFSGIVKSLMCLLVGGGRALTYLKAPQRRFMLKHSTRS